MKRSHRSNASAILMALLAALSATAATVTTSANAAPDTRTTWRCGNVYTDQPCAGGVSIQPADTPSARDRSAADAATHGNERSANAMERDRLRLERSATAHSRATVFPDHRRQAIQERLAATDGPSGHKKTAKSAKPRKLGKTQLAAGTFMAQSEAPAQKTDTAAGKSAKR